MAKGRLLSKKIGLNKSVNELSCDTSRLAYTWTLPHLDRDGRIHGDPAVLKNIIFPRRTDITTTDLEKYVAEWAENGLVIWYEADGDQWLEFPKFNENQPNLRYDREPESTIPPSENGRIITGRVPAECRQSAGSSPR